MQYSRLFQNTVSQLRQAGIEEAEADALQLFEFCFGLTRTGLFLGGTVDVPSVGLERFRDALARRLAREPLHYITGTREFWSLDFIISPAVLVPRPETEFVLERVLETVRDTPPSFGGPVLDMCTGSGVIAVVLARELDAKSVIAADSSLEALLVAARNLEKFGVDSQVSLVCSDLFTAIGDEGLFEIIVANPPYIAEEDIAGLQPEVRDWEPRRALTAPGQGLAVISEITVQASRHLLPGGWLFVEIGSDQGNKVLDLFAGRTGREYEGIEVIKDWSDRPRLLRARRKGVV